MTGLEIALGVGIAALVAAAFGSGTRWSWPVRVRARITSKFGPRNLGDGHKHHAGVDIGVPLGTPVFPIGPGKVVVARMYSPEEVSQKSSGNYIAVDHEGGKRSLYMHLSEISVRPGDVVSPQKPMALSGASGRGIQMGPHLHLEIQVRELGGRFRNVDPLNYVLPI